MYSETRQDRPDEKSRTTEKQKDIKYPIIWCMSLNVFVLDPSQVLPAMFFSSRPGSPVVVVVVEPNHNAGSSQI